MFAEFLPNAVKADTDIHLCQIKLFGRLGSGLFLQVPELNDPAVVVRKLLKRILTDLPSPRLIHGSLCRRPWVALVDIQTLNCLVLQVVMSLSCGEVFVREMASN